MKSTSKLFKGLLGLFLGWVVLVVSSQALAQGTWTTETPMPTARYSLHAASIDGLLYVVGGHDGVAGDTPVHEVYDTTTDTWSTAATLPSWDGGNPGRYGGTMGVIDRKLYLVGGWRIFPPLPTGTLQIYDPTTDSWSLGATIPVPPSSLSACSAGGVIDRKLYVLTACNGWSGYYKYFHVYDPDTNSWSSLPQAPNIHPDPASGVIEGEFYVVGGFDGSNQTAILDVYNPVSNSWTTKAPMPTARAGLVGGVIDGKLYAVGGYDGSSQVDTLEVYDPRTDTWATETSMPTARWALSAGVIDGKLYAVGGYNGSNPVATLEVFNLANLSISPPSGDYVTTSGFDLTLIVEVSDRSVVGGSATLDGSNITAGLASCVIPGTLVSGGQTLRCPGITGESLGTGTHTLDVTLDLSDGTSVSDTVTWGVKDNVEP